MKTSNFNKDFNTPKSYFSQEKRKIFRENNVEFAVPKSYFLEQEKQLLQTTVKKTNYYRFYKVTSVAAVILMVFGIFFLNTQPIENQNISHKETQAYEVLAQAYLSPSQEKGEVPKAEFKDYFNSEKNKAEEVKNLSPTQKVETKTEVQNSIQTTEEWKEEQATELLLDVYLYEETPSVEEVSIYEEDWF